MERPILRDYQKRAVEEVRAVIASGLKRVVMVLPTGAGKSIIFAEIIRLAREKGRTVLWLVHRRNLVIQMQETLEKFGIESGVIMSGIESNTSEPVQLGTMQTYSRRLNLGRIETNRFFIDADLLLIDEGHRSLSKGYLDIIKLYSEKIVIACTATPMRADQRGLGEVYEKIVDVVGVKELTEKGHLAAARYFVPTDIDLDKIKITRGDYEIKGLDTAMNKPKLIGDIVENWLRIAEGRKTIIFCTTVKHSRNVCDAFLSKGIPAYHLDSKSSDNERESAFLGMSNGSTKIITNVALYQEGMDCPDISCVVMARPTKSLGLYRQCVGRGLRPSRENIDCIVIDHGGVVEEHGMVDEEVVWTLDGKKRAWKKKKQKEPKEKSLVTCSVCNLVFEGADKCPDCGSPVKSFGKKVETLDADLEELNGKKATTADKRRWYGMCEAYRKEKGYQPGWTSWTYKEKIGVWPRKMDSVMPIKPDAHFLGWIKYRNIKKAKGKKPVEASVAR